MNMTSVGACCARFIAQLGTIRKTHPIGKGVAAWFAAGLIGLPAVSGAFDLSPTSLSGGGADSGESSKVVQGKRYMESAAEVKAAYVEQVRTEAKEALANPEVMTTPLTVKNFPAFFARFVRPLFVEEPSGNVVQIAEWGIEGKPVRRRAPKPGSKPVTVERFLEVCEDGMTFIHPGYRKRPCGMCDGSCWVIYFPEEKAEAKVFQAKYHKSHAKEGQELAARADLYGYDEVGLNPIVDYRCCWTKVHENALKRYRHTCPVCKGKKEERVLAFCQYELKLSDGEVTRSSTRTLELLNP